MTDRDETRRIAAAHADFYADHAGKDLERFAREHWAPDVKMFFAGMGEPHGIDEFLRVHSPESGFDWDKTVMDVQRMVVDDDTFVLQFAITQWRSHEADAAAAFTGDSADESTNYQGAPVPAINIYTVSDGKVVRIDSYVMVGAIPSTSPG